MVKRTLLFIDNDFRVLCRFIQGVEEHEIDTFHIYYTNVHNNPPTES